MNIKIDKIEISSFGKLKNVVLEAGGGINILKAPNESGKSTLAAFVKFVFYGFAGARSQSLSENERKLYTPWDGEISAGSLNITADGVRYTVARKCLPTGKESFEITERMTGKSVFPGEEPGKVFFGVSEEVFARTLFFRQLSVPQSKDDILADRLQNIAISADEQVNTSMAVSKLNEAKNELKNRLGNGIIPRLTKQKDDLDKQISESMEHRARAQELTARSEERETKIANAENKLKELEAERRNLEKFEALTKLRNINRLSEEERAARDEYETAGAGLKNRDDISGALSGLSALNSSYVAEKTRVASIAEALNTAEADKKQLESDLPFGVDEAETAGRELDKKHRLIIASLVAAGVFALAGIIVLVAASALAGAVLLGVAVVLLGVAGALLAIRSGIAKDMGFVSVAALKHELEFLPERREKISSAEKRVAELRASYNAGIDNCTELKRRLDEGINRYIDSDGGDYSETLQTILKNSTVIGEKNAVWNIKKDELQKACEGVDLNALAAEALGAEKPQREKSTVDTEIRFYTEQSRQLTELQRQDELNITALRSKSGDPAVLVGKRDSCGEKIKELELKYKAYEAAIAAINESGDYMKSMVAPRISARADDYFVLATGNKYGGFEVDTKLSMSYGEDFRRSCEYLSAGTRDSAYLSLRLALADILFGGNSVPMILDDAFVRIDDERLKMMAAALAEAAEKHQIFILTHSEREELALSDAGVDYKNVKIRLADQ